MTMKKIITIFLCVFSVSVFAQTSLTKSEILNLKTQVKKVAKKTKSIKSNFVQKKHLDFLSDDITTYGKLIYKAPSSVKWEYTKPYKYSVVFKNNKLKINDDGKKSDVDLSGSGMFQNMNKLIVQSINGDMFDDKMFAISYAKTKGFYVVNFKTKNSDLKEIISEFVLYFDKNKYEVSTVKMIEPSGDYTQIVFNNRVVNQFVSDAIFTH